MRTIIKRKVEPTWYLALGCLMIVGVATYWLFFTGSSAAEQNIAFSVNSFDTTLWGIVSSKLSVNPPDILKLVVLLGSAVSFRFILLRDLTDKMVQFYLGCFAAGFVFFVFFSNNPSYFLFPALFMGNLLALKVLRRQFVDFHWALKIVCAMLLLLSIYPIANGGRLNATKKLETKAATYYPLTPDRVELYQQLNSSSDSSDLIFTPSVYATDKLTADNFYPAALSGRQFFMGGYRFGGIDLQLEFTQRLDLVDNFSLSDVSQFEMLKAAGATYVLVERRGNKSNVAKSLDDLIKQNTGPYRIEFSNSAGAIFSIP